MKYKITLLFILAFILNVYTQPVRLEKPTIAEASFLEDEAGITAYMNAGQTIDLSLAKQAFRTIEEETDTFIIGSVSLPDYPETEDVHVYVNKDGWIVAYYLKQEPTAKIVDWNDYYTTKKIRRTKLEVAIFEIANKAFIQPKEIKYYHFGYPNANRLIIIVDAMWEGEKEDTFDIKLPSGLTYYERSYVHWQYAKDWYYGGRFSSTIYIDDIQISNITPSQDYVQNLEILSPAQITTDQFHTIGIKASKAIKSEESVIYAIVLIYKTS